MSDVAGQGQYTHLANHHARIVADHLVGTGKRRNDEVVLARWMFTSPPFIAVGSTWASLRDDPDVVTAEIDLTALPRATTDQVERGHLWTAARKSSRLVVAAPGADSTK